MAIANKAKLSDFGNNIYSQFGEDGIIRKIFEIVGTDSKICIEFGAWDGLHGSNTGILWQNGWKALLIERHPQRFKELVNNTKGYDCRIVNTSILSEGKNTIDNIAKEAGLPQNIDLISIDIDGNDYFILKSLEWLSPRVVICEYNPTIPSHIELVAEKDNYFGCSALALENLAHRKGYKLVAVTKTNCFFVKNSDFEAFNSYDTNLQNIMPTQDISYLITGYGGDYAVIGDPPYGSRFPLRQKMIVGSIRNLPIFHFRWILNKKLVKGYIKDSYVHKKIYKVWRHLRYILSKMRWFMGDKKNIAPKIIKRSILKKYAIHYKPSVFIETGTFKGDTTAFVSDLFKEIHSIELSKDLYIAAKKRFARNKSITIHQGDSSTILPGILATLTCPALFWLDGHYSEGETAKGKHLTPIREELQTILNHPIKDHIIFIDDARCFDGSNDYPALEEIVSLVNRLRPNYDISVQADMIHITPKNT